MDRIEELRNKLAHANEYAESREQARDLCAVVRDLLTLREFLREHLDEGIGGAEQGPEEGRRLSSPLTKSSLDEFGLV